MNLQWIPYGQSIQLFINEDELGGNRLSIAGTIIRTDKGTFLIGTMNEVLGTCSCCSLQTRDDITVIEYAYLEGLALDKLP